MLEDKRTHLRSKIKASVLPDVDFAAVTKSDLDQYINEFIDKLLGSKAASSRSQPETIDSGTQTSASFFKDTQRI